MVPAGTRNGFRVPVPPLVFSAVVRQEGTTNLITDALKNNACGSSLTHEI